MYLCVFYIHIGRSRYPPICDEAWNGGGDVQGCNTPEEVAEHSNHAIHSWGFRDGSDGSSQLYAFVVSAHTRAAHRAC